MIRERESVCMCGYRLWGKDAVMVQERGSDCNGACSDGGFSSESV